MTIDVPRTVCGAEADEQLTQRASERKGEKGDAASREREPRSMCRGLCAELCLINRVSG